MPGVFNVDVNGGIILSDEAVKLCPKLKLLTKEQLLYIILAYDYSNGPYRRKPLQERQKLAKRRVWGNKEFDPESFKKIVEAGEEYTSLIYDHNKQMRDVLLEKLDTLNLELIRETQTHKITGLLKAQEAIELRIDSYDQKIDIREQAAILKGDKKLSFIEEMQRNRAEYLKRAKDVVGQDGV